MKKLLAIVLAIGVMLGMSTVAFAARVVDMGSLGSDLFLYNASKEEMGSIGVGSEPVPSGSTLYIPLTTRADIDGKVKGTRISRLSDLGDYKLKLRVTDGKNMVESARFTIQDDFDGRNAAHIAVKTRENNTGKKVEVAFTLTVTPDNGATLEGIDSDNEYEFYFTVAPAKEKTDSSTSSEEEEIKEENTASKPAVPEKNESKENSTNQNVPSDVEKNPETGASSVIGFAIMAVCTGAAALTLKKK